MPLEMWLAFVAASTLMLAIPGPTILLVISHALNHGRRAGAATVGGVALGDLTAMTASMAGLGALLATSATLFSVLKWIGAAYLIYLGVKAWRTPTMPIADEVTSAAPDTSPASANHRLFWHAYVVTALNPKSLIFFVAFVPQFLTPHAPLLPQIALMEATFVILATLNAALYGLLAATARDRIRSPRVQRVANRIGGTLLIGAGGVTGIYQRTQ
ncbi:LysE family translocator [Salinicola sp. RZ23]|uniref:LysE family translocator n=1 Tax=Salinicola sp. RZ23 TaxID=1949087 RepID=UPI000DA19A7D|nr:LysE family translocator [Salinicola sp. RZ23]